MSKKPSLYKSLTVPSTCVEEGELVSVYLTTRALHGDRVLVCYEEAIRTHGDVGPFRRVRKDKFMHYDEAVVGFHKACRFVACRFMANAMGGGLEGWEAGVHQIRFWTNLVRSGRVVEERQIRVALKIFHQLPELGGQQLLVIRDYLKAHRAEIHYGFTM